MLVALGGGMVWLWSRRRLVAAAERERVALELQTLRDEVAHSSRVSTMGQLASSLAHELNQPLAAILRNAEAAEILLEQEPSDIAEIKAIVTDVRLDDLRAVGVIERMRALLKRQPVECTPLSIPELLHDVAALVRSDLLRRQTRLSVELPARLPATRGDRVQLQQVLLNLLINAMDAMTHQAAETRHVVMLARWRQGEPLEVAVADSGPGIAVEDQARLFEPFFSTKPNGMGLGLAISKTIIEAHGGRLWVETRPQGGACFCFTLPSEGEAGAGEE
jgi:C4-dicarboxylate-specific signal transduction histidine kinase